jgi:hypothetical protein
MATLNNEEGKGSDHLTLINYDACIILKQGGGIHIHYGNNCGDIRKETSFLNGVLVMVYGTVSNSGALLTTTTILLQSHLV